ncbi:MAG: ABC transporter ATP-binding protein [Microvirga sp.]
MALLDVEDLQTHFRTPDGVNRAVDGVSFQVKEGETLAIVGESGCGKSVTANSILRLIPEPPGKIAGAIRFQGRDLLALPERAMRDIRGNDISMIFQEPMTSLNPVLTIGRQLRETLRLHEGLERRAAEDRAVEMLNLVGIPEARRRLREYPHQLSGGMRQRVVIAMALSLEPELIILDEPTTALDVVVQREILQQVEALKRDFGFAVLFITHDLSLLLEFADRIAIMYAGELVETASAQRLGTNPRHPYTQRLLQSFPPLSGPLERLTGIPGSPPDLRDPPSGCRFHPRCPHCGPERPDLYVRQTTERPVLREVEPGHRVACHLVEEEEVA